MGCHVLHFYVLPKCPRRRRPRCPSAPPPVRPRPLGASRRPRRARPSTTPPPSRTWWATPTGSRPATRWPATGSSSTAGAPRTCSGSSAPCSSRPAPSPASSPRCPRAGTSACRVRRDCEAAAVALFGAWPEAMDCSGLPDLLGALECVGGGRPEDQLLDQELGALEGKTRRTYCRYLLHKIVTSVANSQPEAQASRTTTKKKITRFAAKMWQAVN